MYNVWPGKRWFGRFVEPSEDLSRFPSDVGGPIRNILPARSVAAFLGYDPGAEAATPDGTTFQVEPEPDFPGFHNFMPPEEEVPGFRMNAGGSMRDDAAPAAWHDPDFGNAFGMYAPSTADVVRIGHGSASPYLADHSGSSSSDMVSMPNEGRPSRTARIALAHSNSFLNQPSGDKPISSLVLFNPAYAGVPVSDSQPTLPSGSLDSSDASKPMFTSFGHSARPFAMSKQRTPLSFSMPIAGKGLSIWELGDPQSPLDHPADSEHVGVAGDEPTMDEQSGTLKPTMPNPVQRVSDRALEVAQANTQPPQSTAAGPGVAVVLPDGSTIPDSESPTGLVMSPVADLGSVAAAGRRTGFIRRMMLLQPLTAAGVPAYTAWALRENLRQGGAFDYQRQNGRFIARFTPVSNINVGLFAQQAGLTLKEILTIAGVYALMHSNNARPAEPYGLHPEQLKYITLGYRIGERGLFGRPAIP